MRTLYSNLKSNNQQTFWTLPTTWSPILASHLITIPSSFYTSKGPFSITGSSNLEEDSWGYGRGLCICNVGEDDIWVYILITTYPFGSILSSEEHPYPTLALDPMFVMIGPLVIEILLVFDVLGGGQHFGTYPHKHSSTWLNSCLRRKPMSYACSWSPVCNNWTASYWDIVSFCCTGGGQHFGTYPHNHSSIQHESWLRRRPYVLHLLLVPCSWWVDN